MTEDRRLIEDFIPIQEISKESAREKSIRKGHISTLHLWWARRPLVASRAAVFASLVGAPQTEAERQNYKQQMIDLCQWKASEITINKAKIAILNAQKIRLNLDENTPLENVPPPKVLDLFAGGGAIPLESLRLGCETYAIDLNPVAHIIELCTLVYPQKYGEKLAQAVERWGNWVIENVRSEIGDLYPNIKIGEDIFNNKEQLELLAPKTKQLNLTIKQELTPVAYLWTRTVKCPNPACGADVPLVRQTWLCKKNKKYVALKIIPNHQTKKVDFQVVSATTIKDLGFDPALGSSRGNSTCHHCGTTIKSKPYIQDEGKAGRIGHQLMAIVCTTPNAKGKTYLSANDFQQYIPNEEAIKQRLDKLCQDTGLTIPDEPMDQKNSNLVSGRGYGFTIWHQLFTSRQLLSLMTFVKWVRKAHDQLLKEGYDEELAKVITTYLTLGITKVANRGCNLGVYHSGRETIESPISNGRLPMSWDFPETNPIGTGSGNWTDSLKYTIESLRKLTDIDKTAILKRQPCQKLDIANSSLDAVITDPPYFDAIDYADLSDYFYIWFKRSIGHLYPEHFSSQLTPKKKEAIMKPSLYGGDKQKASQAYQDMMHQAFQEANRVLKSDGIMCVVYAHKTTKGWSTLIDSLRKAGFAITEAWPLDTELQGGLRGLKASLASSIFLIARKRGGISNTPTSHSPLPTSHSLIGDYGMDVQPLLKQIIAERVKTLMKEGVSGADLVIACVGAGLRAYTQYDTVELPNGEELEAETFLDEVQKEVAETILIEVLDCDSKGVYAIDKATQYYILARYEYGEAVVEFDEANTLAKGVGVELDGVGGLTDGKTALVAKNKNQVQLRNYQERGKYEDLGVDSGKKEFNKPSTPIPIIDILHRLLWLLEHNPSAVGDYLALAQPDSSQLRLVAQALAGRALTPNGGEEITVSRSKEAQQIDTLLASWKRTIEETLFTGKKG